MIQIEKNTAGDSRVSNGVPNIDDFDHANESHINDVCRLTGEFCNMLMERVANHDWTKIKEPYRSMFYRDLCATIEQRMKFEDGEWARLHYEELERHHLKRKAPEDVNMFDVIEMLCDCISAGMARSGEVYDLDIDEGVLVKALNNTIPLLKERIEVVEHDRG